mgnify:CR=1 FL=1
MVKEKIKIIKNEDKKELIERLKKIEGQIRGIIKMIENEEECQYILHQIAAVKNAINKTFSNIISKAVSNNCCINTKSDLELNETQQKIKYISELISKYL